MVSKKKGLSPVIATVLLIAMVLVLIAIIFLWARGFIFEQIEKNGQPIAQVCDGVSFSLESTNSGTSVEVQIVNTGNIPIGNFEVKSIGPGRSDIISLDFGVDVGSAVTSKTIPYVAGTKQLVIYPMILGLVKGKSEEKSSACLDNGEVINL